MELDFPALDPVTIVRNYRDNYVNMRGLLMQVTNAPAGLILKTSQEQPIMKLDLPAALLDAMSAFQKAYPDAGSLTAVKYMRTVNGAPDLVVEDDAPLPEEGNLVTFSHTVSTAWIKAVTIVSHQLVATLASVQSPPTSGTGPKPLPKPIPGPIPSPAPGPVAE